MNTLLEALKLRDWNIECSDIEARLLPAGFSLQYATLPEVFIKWLFTFDCCTNTDQTSWFISRLDYSGSTDAKFRWNEIQLMSLECCETDSDRSEVNAFWQNHFPIALAVRSNYDYFAISLKADNFGAIVHGSAPEYEDTSTISASFNDFMTEFEFAARSESPGWPYVLFFVMCLSSYAIKVLP